MSVFLTCTSRPLNDTTTKFNNILTYKAINVLITRVGRLSEFVVDLMNLIRIVERLLRLTFEDLVRLGERRTA